MATRINTEKAPAAIGPYSQGWYTEDTVYVSGQLGIDMETGKLAEGVEAQAHAAMKNLGAVLEAAGCSYSDILKTTVFVQSMDDFAKINTVYGSYFTETYPARSCVEIAKLPLGGLVEVECIAKRK
ncbi:RidA family protein [Coprococcus comes]|uniref:RidA family protein n=1 Tax=Coprococcus comes TaxID=410072 RepID=A0A3R5ZRG7_9FIRM|nr:RidA family protein [Coprococcus comes]NSF17360.1 RidA family protein [Coprococcus comes]RGU44936.1 RidA family protein [Coprococcus comes]